MSGNAYCDESDACLDSPPRDEKAGGIDWKLAKGKSWDCPECSGTGLTQRWYADVRPDDARLAATAFSCICHRCVMGRCIKGSHVEDKNTIILRRLYDLADEGMWRLRPLDYGVRPTHREGAHNPALARLEAMRNAKAKQATPESPQPVTRFEVWTPQEIPF